MRKYWTSDYAVNKDHKGIVYQFADGGEMEISLAEYLCANPNKTEQDFMELKALSDGIYMSRRWRTPDTGNKNSPSANWRTRSSLLHRRLISC